MTSKVVVCPRSEWADAVAARLHARLRDQPATRLCLPTGATPRPVYDALVARELDLSSATVILLDEFGGLASHDPARCVAMIRRDLLDRLAHPPGRFVRLDPDDGEIEAVRSFDAEVADGGLDLVLLGLGANGHVGLNEPGSLVDAPTRRVELRPETVQGAVRYGATTPPTWGLTLGLAPILAADEVWLLVTGSPKAEILHRALEGPEGPDVPASWLRRHPRLTVLADADAASLLDDTRSTGDSAW